MWFPFRAQSCDTHSSSQGTLGLCKPQSKTTDGRKRQSLISPVGYLEAENVPFQEVFIHMARQREAVFTDQSCWLTALRPAKVGQQVVFQSLGSVLGNAEPCRVSGCQWDSLACASLQTAHSYLKGRMTFPAAGIDALPVKKENIRGLCHGFHPLYNTGWQAAGRGWILIFPGYCSWHTEQEQQMLWVSEPGHNRQCCVCVPKSHLL